MYRYVIFIPFQDERHPQEHWRKGELAFNFDNFTLYETDIEFEYDYFWESFTIW